MGTIRIDLTPIIFIALGYLLGMVVDWLDEQGWPDDL